MAHHILYDYVPRPGDEFRTFRVLWEPYTNSVALRFRNSNEATNGIVGSPEEIAHYLDLRAMSGAPWGHTAPREARRRIGVLIGEDRGQLGAG